MVGTQQKQASLAWPANPSLVSLRGAPGDGCDNVYDGEDGGDQDGDDDGENGEDQDGDDDGEDEPRWRWQWLFRGENKGTVKKCAGDSLNPRNTCFKTVNKKTKGISPMHGGVDDQCSRP